MMDLCADVYDDETKYIWIDKIYLHSMKINHFATGSYNLPYNTSTKWLGDYELMVPEIEY